MKYLADMIVKSAPEMRQAQSRISAEIVKRLGIKL